MRRDCQKGETVRKGDLQEGRLSGRETVRRVDCQEGGLSGGEFVRRETVRRGDCQDGIRSGVRRGRILRWDTSIPSDRIPLVGRRAQNFTSRFGLQCVQEFSFFRYVSTAFSLPTVRYRYSNIPSSP